MMMNSEAVRTLAENGVEFSFDGTETLALAEWCPGNGTRYQLVFARLTPAMCKIAGSPEGAWLVCDVLHGGSLTCSDIDFAHANYVREKLGLRDARPQAVMINCMFGHVSYAKELIEEMRLERESRRGA